MIKQRWFLVTNTENLESLLRRGLLADRTGYKKGSFLRDASALVPEGYLPLFSVENLYEAVLEAKREDENLVPCLIEIDSEQLPNEVLVKRSDIDFSAYSLCSKDYVFKDAESILIEAPLPLSVIKSVGVFSAAERKVLERIVFRFFGKNLGFKIKIEAKLFKQGKKNSNFELGSSEFPLIDAHIPSDRSVDYSRLYSLGGALFTSYYATKNGSQSTHYFKTLFCECEEELKEDERAIADYLMGIQRGADALGLLYAKILSELVCCDDAGQQRYAISHVLASKDALNTEYAQESGLLAKSLGNLLDRTSTKTTEEIISGLRSFYNDRKPKFSMIATLITMLFVRDHLETLLKYYHPDFSERDYFLNYLFSGSVKGIVAVPDELLRIDGLMPWVSYKMAIASGGKFEHLKEPKLPLLIHETCFLSSTKRIQHGIFYQRFFAAKNLDVSDFVKWLVPIRSEVVIGKKGIVFSQPPQVLAELDLSKLSAVLVGHTSLDEFFDFNEIFDLFARSK